MDLSTMVETMAEARNRPLPLPPLLLLPHSIVAHQLSNLQRLPALRKHASMPKRTTSKKQLWRHRAAASPICQALRQQHTRIIEVEVEVVSMRRRVSTFILHPLQAPRHLRHHLLHREEPQYVVVSMSVSPSLSLCSHSSHVLCAKIGSQARYNPYTSALPHTSARAPSGRRTLQSFFMPEDLRQQFLMRSVAILARPDAEGTNPPHCIIIIIIIITTTTTN
jgi:hypothetical protein